MVRERLTGTSKHAMMVVTGGEGGGAALQWRQSTAGLSDSSHFPPQFVSPPYWVKIVRRGDGFSGFLSPDGTTWTQQGSTLTIPMAENVYAGLCVTSHAAGELRTCRFDNLQGNLQQGKIVVFEDRFESSNLNRNNWLIVDGATGSNSGRSEPSREYSLRLNGHPSGGDMVESRSIDLSSHSGALFSYYYEQTGDGASPGDGDDLFVEYWNGSSWVEVNRHLGREFDMDVYKLIVVDLPVDALHADFKLRLRSIGTPDGSRVHADWFVDDVRIEGWDGCAVIFEDNFVLGDHSSTNWSWMEGNTASSKAINPPSPPYALGLKAWDKARSKKIDLSSYSGATLSYHYEQTGSGESPDPDNDLIVSYWMAGGGSRELRRHNGSGPDMTEFDKVTVSLPPEALHNNFKLIIESAGDWYWFWGEFDDWLVDDVMIEVCR